MGKVLKKQKTSCNSSRCNIRVLKAKKVKAKVRKTAALLHYCTTVLMLCSTTFFLQFSPAIASDTQLESLLKNALTKNHEILMMEHRVKGAKHRISQSGALPDPMLMFGYQNEGWSRFTLGEMQGAQWAFSVSQSLPFPGKLSLKKEVAEKEAEVTSISLEALKTSTAQRVYELYYDLFLVQKSLQLLKSNHSVLQQMEEIALSRLSLGLIRQQEVLSIQSQKYMLMEQEAMFRQKAEALEGMLNTIADREVSSPFSPIPDIELTDFNHTLQDLIRLSEEGSFELKTKRQAQKVWESKIDLARREYYPDFTVSAGIFPRTGPFLDMWSLTVSMNIPLFYKSKQRQMVYEAEAMSNEARHEIKASMALLQASLRENLAMIQSADKIMEIYKKALIPTAYQELETMLYSYRVGTIETSEVVQKIRQIIDLESAYWRQVVDRQKAVIRIKALTGKLLESVQR